MRTRVKICGITRVEDALAAVDAGADAIGLVFYPPSPRAVSFEQAAGIARVLPAFVTVTALVVNPEPCEVETILERVKPDLLQFHGDETPAFCGGYGNPYIKAVRMRPDVDLECVRSEYGNARGILLDAYRKGVPGGTGEQFDWNRIPAHLAGRIVLAGGLSASNIRQAVEQVRPYAVDVSGGVEAAKGIKDHELIRRFINEVKCADECRS